MKQYALPHQDYMHRRTLQEPAYIDRLTRLKSRSSFSLEQRATHSSLRKVVEMTPNNNTNMNTWYSIAAAANVASVVNTNSVLEGKNNLLDPYDMRLPVDSFLESDHGLTGTNSCRMGFEFGTPAPTTENVLTAPTYILCGHTLVGAMSNQPATTTCTPCTSAIPNPTQSFLPSVDVGDVLTALSNDPVLLEQLSDTLQAPAVAQDGRYVPHVSSSSLLTNEQSGERLWNRQSLSGENTAFCEVDQRTACKDLREENKQPQRRDRKYLERRRKNNLAAKRSRAAKRNKDLTNKHRAAVLRKENIALQTELLSLRQENAHLKSLAQQKSLKMF